MGWWAAFCGFRRGRGASWQWFGEMTYLAPYPQHPQYPQPTWHHAQCSTNCYTIYRWQQPGTAANNDNTSSNKLQTLEKSSLHHTDDNSYTGPMSGQHRHQQLLQYIHTIWLSAPDVTRRKHLNIHIPADQRRRLVYWHVYNLINK